jgi:hypothetical protein
MSQIIDYACPSITCEVFNKPFEVTCWDRDEELYSEGNEGEPCEGDDPRCDGCGTFMEPADDVKLALDKLVSG